MLEPLTLRGEVAAGAWRALAQHPHAARVIHTVASPESAADIVALASPETPRRVVLEGLTSMRRFGMTEDEVAAAITTLSPHIASGAIRLEGLALHLPIATPEEPRIGSMAMLTSDDSVPQPVVIGSARVHEVVAWGLLWPNLLANLAGLSDAGSLWVSHLDDRECSDVREALPDLPLRLRLGTRLWLGDREALFAAGTVLAVHATPQGQSAGYHQRRGPREGYVVAIGGGHLARRRADGAPPRPQRPPARGRSGFRGAGGRRSVPFTVPAALRRSGVVPRAAAHARVDAAHTQGHDPPAGRRAAGVRRAVHDRPPRRDHRLSGPEGSGAHDPDLIQLLGR